MIRTVVWGENIHERVNEDVRKVYPDGMHEVIAASIQMDQAITASTATLQEPENGLPANRLAETDVLVWWGHKDHGSVDAGVVENIASRVFEGMGLIVLHSGHFSKPFKRLMGTPCALKWREAGERERLWVVNPGHPIASGLPESFVLENEEMYGEFFSVPEPLETIFISWFAGGEVFRSGMTWRRGAGNIFYFRPGHETYPTYHHPTVQKVIRNAVHWAYNPQPMPIQCQAASNVATEDAAEPILNRGPRLHRSGEPGYR